MSKLSVSLNLVIRTRRQLKREEDDKHALVVVSNNRLKRNQSKRRVKWRREHLPDILESSREGEPREEAMAEPRGPIITPGKFRGGVEENVDEYLTQFKRVA